jgi:multiple sugar transport system permease protein
MPERRRRRIPWGAFLLLAPALALLLIFFIIPVGDALYLSLTNGEFQGAHSRVFQFIGLANYQRMLHDIFLGNSLLQTAIYVGASAVIGQTVLGIILALLSEQAWHWLRLSVGSIIITAWVAPQIVQATVWSSFAVSGGTLDQILGPHYANTNWLVTAPMFIVCVANLWRSVALSMLLFGAGLRNISHEVKEAATLDGATYWQRLLYVILPIMKPTVVTNFILVTLGNLSDFTLIFVLTQGGPGNATQTLPLYIYEQAFNYYELGYGTAIAMLLIAIGAAASLLYVRLLRAEI